MASEPGVAAAHRFVIENGVKHISEPGIAAAQQKGRLPAHGRAAVYSMPFSRAHAGHRTKKVQENELFSLLKPLSTERARRKVKGRTLHHQKMRLP